ncbi:MAG: transposase [Comamonadaceae bacterium]
MSTTKSDTNKSSSAAAAPGPTAEPHFAAFIAIDWGDEKHAVALRVAGQTQTEHTTLEQKPEALTEWIAGLRQRFAGATVAIILEQKRGALLYALQPHEHLVLFPVNPQMSAKFRQAFYPSGAKDDPTDADLQLDILLQHRDRLTAWRPADVTTRQLSLLVQSRRRFVADQVRVTNRLRDALKSYFPQALELAGEDLTSPMACAFLQKWPALEALQQVKPAALRKFYYAHHSRSEELIAQRLQLQAQAQPLTTDPAIIAAQSLLVQSLAQELATLNPVLARYEKQIAKLFVAHTDHDLWDSFPGAGPALGPRLAVAWGTQRDRFPDPQAMPCFSGIAPVKEASGKQLWIHVRWACPKFQRQTFHEMAKCSLTACAWALCYYQMQIERGKGRQAAIRALAFKWQRIMWRCWQDHTPYDDAKYVASLKRSASDLYRRLLAAPTTQGCE